MNLCSIAYEVEQVLHTKNPIAMRKISVLNCLSFFRTYSTVKLASGGISKLFCVRIVQLVLFFGSGRLVASWESK